VDDDRVILTTISEGLRQEGYVVTTAASGEEALEVTKNAAPDLALLDIRMPGMSGVELAKRLSDEREIPSIFLSAFDDHDIVRLAAEQGALGYLVKPMLPQQIVPTIEAALARAEEIKALRDREQQLRDILDKRQTASIAVGVIMERAGLDRRRAFEALRRCARDRQQKLSDLAEEIVAAAELLTGIEKK